MELASLRKDAKLQNSLDTKLIADLNGDLAIQKNRVSEMEIILKKKKEFVLEGLTIEKNVYIMKSSIMEKSLIGFSSFGKKNEIRTLKFGDQRMIVEGDTMVLVSKKVIGFA